jgi:hypothetical protein
MHIRFQMLLETAALSLLTILHTSQLIQGLGPPWCDRTSELRKGFPHPAPRAPLTRLAKLVFADSRRPATFKYGPWVRRANTSDRLITVTVTSIPRGEDRKRSTRDITREVAGKRADTLLIFCHGACPSNKKGTPAHSHRCLRCVLQR